MSAYFQPGRRYSCQTYFDGYDSTRSMTVASRTARTLHTAEGRMLRIKLSGNVESVYPFGRYTGCIIFRADRDLVEVPADARA